MPVEAKMKGRAGAEASAFLVHLCLPKTLTR